MRDVFQTVLSALIVSFIFAAGVLVWEAQAIPSGVTGYGSGEAVLTGEDCIETCSIQQEYNDDQQYGDEQYEEPYDDQYDDPYNQEGEDQYGDADEQYNDDYGDPGYQEEVYPDDEYSEEYGTQEAEEGYGDQGTYDEGLQ